MSREALAASTVEVSEREVVLRQVPPVPREAVWNARKMQETGEAEPYLRSMPGERKQGKLQAAARVGGAGQRVDGDGDSMRLVFGSVTGRWLVQVVDLPAPTVSSAL